LYLIDKDEEAAFQRQPIPPSAYDLPRAAPLAMPTQDLTLRPSRGHDAPLDDLGPLFQRRMFLIVGSFLLGLLAVNEMFAPLQADGIDLIDSAFCVLFFGLFAWIAFGFLNSVAGFFALLAGGPAPVRPEAPLVMPVTRTAVLMPIYNEEVGPVFRRLEAMATSIEALGGAEHFDIFILSDSNERSFAAEYAAFHRLRDQRRLRIYYRRREQNVARKPGNIAEWVRRFGAAYAYMIVLDADSLMSGSAMMRLATAMDARPGIGLLQTVPALLNGQTMFARWHQFAAALYGPVASAGLRWWSGTEATFWGHNAILRVRAFAESCGLPELEGAQLLGGHILSHDMVEAALLRRRGWAVHMVNLPHGSYEEFPPTMVDHAVRDRRWCQGNLQHLRLLHAAGFHWVSRLQLVMGASAYLTSPLWLLLLGAGIFEQVRGDFEGYLLVSSGWLMGLTIMLLLGPKIVALMTLTFDGALREAMGGWRRVLGGMVLEIFVSIVAAPVTMLTQTMAIVDILRGRESGWRPQRRDVDGLDLVQVGVHYRWHVALGLALFAGMAIGVAGMIWTLPVAVGLMLAPLTVWLTARSDVGGWLVRRGLLLSPADRERFDGDRTTEAEGPATLNLVAIPQN
jgi:membrane glycosyltransferase